MTTAMITFPVQCGIHGMNALALFLNQSDLAGLWHFGLGTRFDQTSVAIDFDDPADAAPSWQRYCDTRPSSS